jgi:ABC-2 type transport system permease protein
MAKTGHIFWREFRAYFVSWIAYAMLAGWLLIAGALFSMVLTAAMRPGTPLNVTGVYSTLVVMLIFIVPLLTMRLIAEERNTGTLEMLQTSPLTDWQVVIAKFLAAWGFFAVMVGATVYLPIIAAKNGSIDNGPIFGCYIALLCLGAAAAAFGLFCSSLTESQVVAGFLTFSGLLFSWILSYVQMVSPTSDVAVFISQWSIYTHFENMLGGAIDTKDLVFFASVTFLFLFATVRGLESRKWR